MEQRKIFRIRNLASGLRKGLHHIHKLSPGCIIIFYLNSSAMKELLKNTTIFLFPKYRSFIVSVKPLLRSCQTFELSQHPMPALGVSLPAEIWQRSLISWSHQRSTLKPGEHLCLWSGSSVHCAMKIALSMCFVESAQSTKCLLVFPSSVGPRSRDDEYGCAVLLSFFTFTTC